MKDSLVPASIILAGLLIGGAVIYNSSSNASTIDNKINDNEVLLEVTADDIILGSADAPITVIEYSDPSCSFCGAASGENEEVANYLKQRDPSWTAALPGLKNAYIENGDVRLVFRYFPGHGKGEEAAKAMFCANEQDKFWELHDLVFALFAEKESVGYPEVRQLAEGLEINMNDYDNCIAEDRYADKITNDTAGGKALGISGTPGFLINGVLLEGAYSFSQFQLIIDDMLGR